MSVLFSPRSVQNGLPVLALQWRARGGFFVLGSGERWAARFCLWSLVVQGRLSPLHERIMGSRMGEEWLEVVPDVGLRGGQLTN